MLGRVLMLLTILAVPLSAADDVNASIRYLESDADCSDYAYNGSGSYEGGWYDYSSEGTRCNAWSQPASVVVSDDVLGSTGVSAYESEWSNEGEHSTRNGGSHTHPWDGANHTWTWGEGSSSASAGRYRTVYAWTSNASAQASWTCDSSSSAGTTSSDDTERGNQTNASIESRGNFVSSSSQCGTYLTASAFGQPVGASRSDDCHDYRSDRTSVAQREGEETVEGQHSSTSDRCTQRTTLNAPERHVVVTDEDGCYAEENRSTQQGDDQYRSGSWNCMDAITAGDGNETSVFVGRESNGYHSCYASEPCVAYEESFHGVRVTDPRVGTFELPLP